MRKFFAVLLLLISIGSFGLLIFLYGDNIKDYAAAPKEYQQIKDNNTSPGELEIPENTPEDLKKIIEKEQYACIDVDYEKLKKQNDDYIGWIYVPGTKISYPVVKSEDNNDYLHKSFKKTYSFSGTIFMDCRNNGNIYSTHSILYGHNMKNGTMFAGLKKFTSQKYLEEHPIFWFIDDEGNKLLFKIFSVEKPDAKDSFTYNCFETYEKSENWERSVEKICSRSLIKTNIDVKKEDMVMSMSTCTGNKNTRCVVHGILIF